MLSIFDKILVHEEGETEEEATRDHDAKVHALMKRCHERNIKLNKEKAQLHRKEVPFKGHVITNEGLKADPEKLSCAGDANPYRCCLGPTICRLRQLPW